MIEESRNKIIEGLQELKDSCNRIAPAFCHDKCPYEDICLKLRCVGKGYGIRVQPCNWDLEKLK